MSEELIYPGGLMRCCLQTWDIAIKVRPAGWIDGDILTCKYCDSQMIRTNDVWRWDRPCGFGYHRLDCEVG